MTWNYGYTTNEEFRERTLRFEVKVKMSRVPDLYAAKVGERTCLECAGGVEVEHGVLYVPR